MHIAGCMVREQSQPTRIISSNLIDPMYNDIMFNAVPTIEECIFQTTFTHIERSILVNQGRFYLRRKDKVAVYTGHHKRICAGLQS